jgi:hypothetical protein
LGGNRAFPICSAGDVIDLEAVIHPPFQQADWSRGYVFILTTGGAVYPLDRSSAFFAKSSAGSTWGWP